MKTNPLAIIKKKQTLFRSLTGITQEKFDELVKKTTPLYEQAEEKRLYKAKRERKQGGGRQKELDLSNQLLMLLMYYRVYVSQEFLGLIFGLHNCNVSRQINYLQPLLATVFRILARQVQLYEAGGPVRKIKLTEEELLNPPKAGNRTTNKRAKETAEEILLREEEKTHDKKSISRNGKRENTFSKSFCSSLPAYLRYVNWQAG